MDNINSISVKTVAQEHVDTATTTFQASYSRLLLNKMKEAQKEKGLSRETMIRLTRIPKTTFRRTWDSDDKDIRMDIDFAYRVCQLLGGELADQMQALVDTLPQLSELSPENLPNSESVKSEIVESATELLSERKKVIDEQSSEIITQDEKITALQRQLDEKNQEIIHLQADYLERTNVMVQELKARHDELVELNCQHLARIDKLQDELNCRNEQIAQLYQLLLDQTAKNAESGT